jgi:hypothetical protein
MKQFLTIAAVLAAFLALSCQVNVNGDDNNTQTPAAVDFSSHNSDYSIIVKNNTSKRLVAFKGELRTDAIIGGIPAGGSNHYLPKTTSLFSGTDGFVLILLTEEQYEANKTNLSSQTNTPFTRIFAFYNAQGTNESVYEISGRLGGNRTITINNSLTGYDVEIRLNGIYGETLGYARAGMLNTRLYVGDGDYYLFPVLVKYAAAKNEIITVYPKESNGNAKYDQFALDDTDPARSITIDQGYLAGTNYSTGTAWLIVENGTSSGIQLQRGGSVQLTSTGIATINNGSSRTFQIKMAKIDNTSKYESSVTTNAYTVGSATYQTAIGNHTLEEGKVYKVTVTGAMSSPEITWNGYQRDISLDDFE